MCAKIKVGTSTSLICAIVVKCGLDGLRVEHVDMAVQEEVFASQLHLAKELHRPVSVHCVKAFEQMLALVQEMGPFPAGFMLHSWTGSPEMVRAFSKIEVSSISNNVQGKQCR